MPDLPAPTASAERRGDRSSSHGRAPRGHQHAPPSTTSRSTTGLGANGTAMACAPAVARFGGWIARPAPGAGLGVAGGHLSTAHPRGRDRHTPGMSDPRIPPTHRPDWPRASRPGSTPSPAAHRQCRRRVSNGSPADVAHPAGRRCRNARRRKSWHDRDQTRPWQIDGGHHRLPLVAIKSLRTRVVGRSRGAQDQPEIFGGVLRGLDHHANLREHVGPAVKRRRELAATHRGGRSEPLLAESIWAQ